MAIEPIPVIKPLDELHRGSTGLLPSIEMVMMVEIVLEDREKRLRGSVIPTRTRGPYRLRDAVVSAPPRELLRRILTGFNRWIQHRLVGSRVVVR